MGIQIVLREFFNAIWVAPLAGNEIPYKAADF